jgi:hypothetical protein
MEKHIDLKHSVIKEDADGAEQGEDEDLDIYSKFLSPSLSAIDLHRESKELVLHGEQEISKVCFTSITLLLDQLINEYLELEEADSQEK